MVFRPIPITFFDLMQHVIGPPSQLLQREQQVNVSINMVVLK